MYNEIECLHVDSVRFIKGRENSVDFSFLSLFSIFFFSEFVACCYFQAAILSLWLSCRSDTIHLKHAHYWSVFSSFLVLFFLYKHQLCYNSCTVQASLTCNPTQADVSNNAAICGGLIDEMFSCLFFNDPFMADAVPWLKKKTQQ